MCNCHGNMYFGKFVSTPWGGRVAQYSYESILDFEDMIALTPNHIKTENVNGSISCDGPSERDTDPAWGYVK